MLESINVDERTMLFYLDYSIDELWKSAFRNEKNAVLAVKHGGKSGNKYRDRVRVVIHSIYVGLTRNDSSYRSIENPVGEILMSRHFPIKVHKY